MRPIPLLMVLITTLSITAIGCGSAGDTGEPVYDNVQVGSEETNNIDEPGETGVLEANPPVEEELVCEAGASGTLRLPEEEITLTDVIANIEAGHNPSGCISSLYVDLQWGEACMLDMTFVASADRWSVTSLSVGACEALAPFQGATLDASASTFGLLSEPIAAADLDEQCLDGSALSMVGRLVFNNGDTTEEFMLDGLTINGDVMSIADPQGECAPAVETCVNLGCGPDTFGVHCGGCEEGFKCIDAECMVWNCPIEGPFGTEEGDKLIDLSFPDCDGNMVSLHNLCGAPAGYVTLLAGY